MCSVWKGSRQCWLAEGNVGVVGHYLYPRSYGIVRGLPPLTHQPTEVGGVPADF